MKRGRQGAALTPVTSATLATLAAFATLVVATGQPSTVALADAPAAPVRLAPSADGHVGAWLVAGPFDPPLSPVEEPPSPRLDEPVGAGGSSAPGVAPPRWRLASSNDGSLDVAGALESRSYAFAYA